MNLFDTVIHVVPFFNISFVDMMFFISQYDIVSPQAGRRTMLFHQVEVCVAAY